MMIPADSIIIDVNSEFRNRVECNESDVTGLKTMQIKGKLDKSNCNDDLSNVLYSKTYVVRGSGKAIVCAVGHRTQFGMPVEFEDDYQIRDEKSPFKDMLSAYSLKLGNYGNYLVIFLIALIPFRRFLEAKGIIECSIDN
jgi:magnesium-transporting ATPase (P-type)